jgi:hypothetical protein
MLIGLTGVASVSAGLMVSMANDNDTLPFAVSAFSQTALYSLVTFGYLDKLNRDRCFKYFSLSSLGMGIAALGSLACYKLGLFALPVVPLINSVVKEYFKNDPDIVAGVGSVEVFGASLTAITGMFIGKRNLIDISKYISFFGANTVGYGNERKEKENLNRFSAIKYPALFSCFSTFLLSLFNGTVSGVLSDQSMSAVGAMIATAATASAIAPFYLAAGAVLGYEFNLLAESISSSACVKSCFNAIGGCFSTIGGCCKKTWCCIYGSAIPCNKTIV